MRNHKVEAATNKKATLTRLLKYVLTNYKFSFAVVALCIVITSVTTLISNLFTRTLIDDYVVPLTQATNPLVLPAPMLTTAS